MIVCPIRYDDVKEPRAAQTAGAVASTAKDGIHMIDGSTHRGSVATIPLELRGEVAA